MTHVNPSSSTCDASSRGHSRCQDGTDATTPPIELVPRERSAFLPSSTRDTSPTRTRALDSSCRKTKWKAASASKGCCDVGDGSHREGCCGSACQRTAPTVSHLSGSIDRSLTSDPEKPSHHKVVVDTASASSWMMPHHANPTSWTTPSLAPLSPTVCKRTATASDVVDYMGVARETLWRAIGRCLAAALLPHLFMWLAISILVPRAENERMRESAASLPLDLYAVTRNHPELAFIILEVSITSLLGSGLAHFFAAIPRQGPRALGKPSCDTLHGNKVLDQLCTSSESVSDASMDSRRNCNQAHCTPPKTPTRTRGTLAATTRDNVSQQDLVGKDLNPSGSCADSTPPTGIHWMGCPTPAWFDASKEKECASSGHQTDPLLCVTSLKDAQTLALSHTFRCDGCVPSITCFGFFIGYAAYMGFGTWRLAITYYFAWYSFQQDDNAAVWLWLLPAGLLSAITYLMLLMGGHTLRRRACQQLKENMVCRHSEGEGEQKIPAHRVAAATATMRRLRWVSWCLVCVPHPHPEAASNLTWQGTAKVFSSPQVNRDKMQDVFVRDTPSTSTPAASIAYMEDDPCDDAGTSTPLSSALSKRIVVDVSASKSHPLLKCARASEGDVYRVAQKMKTRGVFGENLPSEAAASSAAMDRPSSASDSVQRTRRSSKFCAVKWGLLTFLKNIVRCRCAPTSSLRRLPWIWGGQQASAPTEVQPWGTQSSLAPCANQGLHIYILPMRAWHWCSVASQRCAHWLLEQFGDDSLRALECALVWLYLLMLFFFTTLLLCLLYFTWWWRRIIGMAAAAAMYATDTENVTVPLPPSLEVYRCTKAQAALRSVVWALPPVCSLPDVGAASQGSSKWSAGNRIALLFTLMGKSKFQVPYFYVNIALPIGFACTLYLFLQELMLHLQPHRVLRHLRLHRFRFDVAAWRGTNADAWRRHTASKPPAENGGAVLHSV